MKKLSRKILGTGMVGLASLLPMKAVQAQGNVHGSLEAVQSVQSNGTSYPRLNVSSTLPGQISSYTFLEFYGKDNGYFGRSTFNRPITQTGGVGPRATIIHGGEPVSQVGLGVGAVVPHMPRGTFASVGVLPVWMDKEGRAVRDRTEVQYFASANLPLRFNVNGFGIWNIASPTGPEWTYGEVKLGRNFGPINISYNPALLNNGDGNARPRVENRFTVELKFGGQR